MKKKMFEIMSALFLISILSFIFIQILPGEPAENYLRASHLPITEKLLRQKREELGLNEPLVIQYLIWLKNIFLGKFGYSFLRKEPVVKLATKALYNTFQLSIVSTFLIISISLPLGVVSALKKDKLVDKIIQTFTLIFVSLPVFLLGFSLMLILSVKLKLLPVSGKGNFYNFILPSITLAIPFIGQYISVIRKSIIESVDSIFLENAKLRGLKTRYIIINYYIKSASVPIITAFMLSYIYILTGSILVEEIFAWPGIGVLFIRGLQAGDVPLIQICILIFGILFIFINLFTTYFLKFLNPKIGG